MGNVVMSLADMRAAQSKALAEHDYVDEDGKTPEGKHWWLVRREFPDGRTLYLYPCGSGVSLGVSMTPTDVGYRTVYDYFSVPWAGWVAALTWDGQDEPEPSMWDRAHRIGCQTRRKDGGFGEEYVRD